MWNITETDIIFNRSYYYKNYTVRYTVDGTFFDPIKDHYNTILIGGLGTLKQGWEMQLYENTNRTCGIFNVSLSMPVQATWYDLRVLNSSLSEGPAEDCMEAYNQFTKKSRKIYNDTCQSIL
ncbi:uncharacterized protein LOC125946876 [Dermacentor silvarum]|uniref:uncharacterized protein LOC125946876 n=1 Tax=Dermacentor silvarum TaxID=543639 RepID=UPI002100E121|nr:uncharacterized protein LOC125946876 [Dermacentor silvarum]